MNLATKFIVEDTSAENKLLMPCRLAPTAAFYRMVARHDGEVVICGGERFDKRMKEAHRFEIADTRGVRQLTVPVEKPFGATWADTRVSLHGRWWEVMSTALESAYGRTPFFEFYADDFLPLIANPEQFTTISELNFAFDRAIRRALGLQTPVSYSVDPTLLPVAIEPFTPAPYWQIRANTLGFLPNLSILDLIFNHGPEALLALL